MIFALKRVKNPEKTLKITPKIKINPMGERARACVGGEVCRMMCSVPRGMIVGGGNWVWWRVRCGVGFGGRVLVEGRIFKEET